MKKTVVLSDLTGVEVATPAHIKVTIGTDLYLVDADADDPVVAQLVEVGRKQKRRGRKAKATA